MEELKQQVYSLYDSNNKLSLEEYNYLIGQCVEKRELAAIVFLYDHMKSKDIPPNKETFNLINRVHSKTVQENNNILIKTLNIRQLKPKRRIHKIMKGHNYSKNYQKALIHIDKVKEYVKNNPDVKYLDRIHLAKDISKNCKISLIDSRYIVTNLKKTKFLKFEHKVVSDFSEVEKFLDKTAKKSNPLKQSNLSSFFTKV